MSKQRSYWGWGYEGTTIDSEALKNTVTFLCRALGVEEKATQSPLPMNGITLRAPRFDIANSLENICTSSKQDRLSHSFGKSYFDVIRGMRGQFINPPDYVAYPENESHLQQLMAFAQQETIALIPFGGGSSVVGGVEPTTDEHFNGVISVDMARFNQLLEVDEVSRCARFQAGIYGPALEDALKPYRLTLRHFPQSFEFSTLGGWIATRAGGHFASLYTHIDDLVESVRIVTPQGVAQTIRLPGSGAGPSEERFILGSEGIFGFITEAWLKLQEVPTFKKTVTLQFQHYEDAVNATRLIAQSGLYPSNCRLVEPLEAFGMGLGNGSSSVLLLGFESATGPVEDKLNQSIQIAKKWGATLNTNQNDTLSDDAESWKKSFLQAPYLRDVLAQMCILSETFETAITWDKFNVFHTVLKQEVQKCIIETCGAGLITCRFTHVYPDGPAPYYTVIAKTEAGKEIEQWKKIKKVASDIIIEYGATITHHHAVGKDHLTHYEQQRSPFFTGVLKASKQRIDPKGILNPGVLIDMKK